MWEWKTAVREHCKEDWKKAGPFCKALKDRKHLFLEATDMRDEKPRKKIFICRCCAQKVTRQRLSSKKLEGSVLEVDAG